MHAMFAFYVGIQILKSNRIPKTNFRYASIRQLNFRVLEEPFCTSTLHFAFYDCTLLRNQCVDERWHLYRRISIVPRPMDQRRVRADLRIHFPAGGISGAAGPVSYFLAEAASRARLQRRNLCLSDRRWIRYVSVPPRLRILALTCLQQRSVLLHLLRMMMWDPRTKDQTFKEMMRDFARPMRTRRPAPRTSRRLSRNTCCRTWTLITITPWTGSSMNMCTAPNCPGMTSPAVSKTTDYLYTSDVLALAFTLVRIICLGVAAYCLWRCGPRCPSSSNTTPQNQFRLPRIRLLLRRLHSHRPHHPAIEVLHRCGNGMGTFPQSADPESPSSP